MIKTVKDLLGKQTVQSRNCLRRGGEKMRAR